MGLSGKTEQSSKSLSTARRRLFLACLAVLLFNAGLGEAADTVTIKVHLFKGAWGVERPALNAVTVMTATSHPALVGLRDKVDAPDSELTSATIDALLDAFGLRTVDDILAFAVEWDGQEPILGQNVLHKIAAFQFAFAPTRAAIGKVGMTMTLRKSKDSGAKDERSRLAEAHRALLEGNLDTILDTKLDLEIGTPVVAAIPMNREAYFLAILLSRRAEGTKQANRDSAKSSPGGDIIPAPKAVHTVMPAYPEELRKHGVRGQVELKAAVDEKGSLMGIQVTKSLHPYLDFAAVQALRQWKYEPSLQNGKPVPVIITQTVNFDPDIYRSYEEDAKRGVASVAAGKTGSREELAGALEGSAEYCGKLEGSALDFICEERIKEVHYNFAKDMSWNAVVVSPRGGGGSPYVSTWIPSWDPQRTEKHDYTCDYLFIKKGASIEERRIVLKDNGRAISDRSRFLEEKRFTALNPLLATVRILSRDRQPLFNFRIIDEDHVNGREAYVIEAIPKSGNTWGVEYAKIWIDRSGWRVLRSEIQGVPLEGYDDVLADTTQFNIKPILLTSHKYNLEKNGVFFPSHTTIRVDYPEPTSWISRATPKLKIEMEYTKYKFFTVETDQAIKK